MKIDEFIHVIDILHDSYYEKYLGPEALIEERRIIHFKPLFDLIGKSIEAPSMEMFGEKFSYKAYKDLFLSFYLKLLNNFCERWDYGTIKSNAEYEQYFKLVTIDLPKKLEEQTALAKKKLMEAASLDEEAIKEKFKEILENDFTIKEDINSLFYDRPSIIKELSFFTDGIINFTTLEKFKQMVDVSYKILKDYYDHQALSEQKTFYDFYEFFIERFNAYFKIMNSYDHVSFTNSIANFVNNICSNTKFNMNKIMRNKFLLSNVLKEYKPAYEAFNEANYRAGKYTSYHDEYALIYKFSLLCEIFKKFNKSKEFIIQYFEEDMDDSIDRKFRSIFNHLENFNFDTNEKMSVIGLIGKTCPSVEGLKEFLDKIGELLQIIHNYKGHRNSQKENLSLIGILFNNKNIGTSVGLFNDLFDCYCQIKDLDYKTLKNPEEYAYNKEKAAKFLSPDWEKDFKFIVSLFESNAKLSGNSEKIDYLLELIRTTRGNIELIRDWKETEKIFIILAARDYFKVPEFVKVSEILEKNINNNLKFHILGNSGKEIMRALRIGVESNCCQALGNIGKEAAVDSVINPTAGVLILEDKFSKLLSQSYFHITPTDKDGEYTIILDNIEWNAKNCAKYGIDNDALSAIYSKYAKESVNEALGKGIKIVGFYCGTDHNKLINDMFEDVSIGEDPRSFDVENYYTDFDSDSCINILNYKGNDSEAYSYGEIKQANIFLRLVKLSRLIVSNNK